MKLLAAQRPARTYRAASLIPRQLLPALLAWASCTTGCGERQELAGQEPSGSGWGQADRRLFAELAPPAPPEVTFFGLWGRGEQELLAVGSGGAIFSLTPATGAWTDQSLPGQHADLLAIHGLPDGPILAAGRNGTVLRRLNGSWEPLAGVPVNVDLRGVWLASPELAYLVGDEGVILCWRGDATGFDPPVQPVRERLDAVLGLAADDVWAVGHFGVVLHGDGESWSRLPSGTSEHLAGLAADPALGLVAVGLNGARLGLGDEPRWQPAPSATAPHPQLRSVAPLPASAGAGFVMVGWEGAVLLDTGQRICDLSIAPWRLEAVWAGPGRAFAAGAGARVLGADLRQACPALPPLPSAADAGEGAGGAGDGGLP